MMSSAFLCTRKKRFSEEEINHLPQNDAAKTPVLLWIAH